MCYLSTMIKETNKEMKSYTDYMINGKDRVSNKTSYFQYVYKMTGWKPGKWLSMTAVKEATGLNWK